MIKHNLRDKYENFIEIKDNKLFLRRITSMKWKEGKGYSDALIKTYKNVFMQFSIWSCTKGSVKYIAIPFYASYVIIFTVIPLMPIIGTLSEASYFKEAGGYV